MPHSAPLPFDHGTLCSSSLGCRRSFLALNNLQHICNLGGQRITKIILDLVALTKPVPGTLQVVPDNLSFLGVIGGMRAHEETHDTVLDALLPSPIDDLRRRFEHLILLHLFAGIGPFPLELIDAVLHIASRQLYLFHLICVELLVKRCVLLYFSLSLFVLGFGLTFPEQILSRWRGISPMFSHNATHY